VPLREIVNGELVALLTTLMLPTAAPALAGVKFAVSGRLWPAARVTAPGNPVTVKPTPVAATCETLTLPVPVFVRVKGCEVALPTSRLPKLRLDVLADSKEVCVGLELEGKPLPETGIEICPPPLWPVVITMLPVNVVAALGVKTI